MLNFPLLKHPLNWLTIATMLLVGFYVFHLVACHYHDEHPGKE